MAAEPASGGEAWAFAFQVWNGLMLLGVVAIVAIAATSIAHTVVGQRTSFTVSFSVSIGIDIASVASLLIVLARLRQTRSSAAHLRRLNGVLERENAELRNLLTTNLIPLSPGVRPAQPLKRRRG